MTNLWERGSFWLVGRKTNMDFDADEIPGTVFQGESCISTPSFRKSIGFEKKVRNDVNKNAFFGFSSKIQLYVRNLLLISRFTVIKFYFDT